MTRNTADEVLYGARHEDSALFSVAEVERATAANEHANSGESSGYIDVAALAAPQPRDEGPAASLLRMAIAPQRATTPKRGGLYGVIAGLSLALLSSITALAASPRDEPAPSDEVTTDLAFELDDPASDVLDAPFDDERMIVLAVDDEYEADEPRGRPRARARAREGDHEELAQRLEEALDQREQARREAGGRPRERAREQARRARRDVGRLPPQPRQVQDQGERPGARPEAQRPGRGAPEKLDTSALKAGIAAAKDAAEARCEDLADGGDKVEVKLSIRGSTGKVSSAEVRGAAAGTALGTCVARELKTASFDRFEAAQQGLIVTVRF